MREVLQNEDALNARVFQFPTSAIKEGGKKIIYFDFLTATDYDMYNRALLRMIPRIDMENISEFIEQTFYISTRINEDSPTSIGGERNHLKQN